MRDNLPLDNLRLVFIALSILAVVFMAYRLGQVWRSMKVAQRLFTVGAMCMLIYAADTHREAYVDHIEWRWRLIFFSVGVVCFGCWALMPLTEHRRQNRTQ